MKNLDEIDLDHSVRRERKGFQEAVAMVADDIRSGKLNLNFPGLSKAEQDGLLTKFFDDREFGPVAKALDVVIRRLEEEDKALIVPCDNGYLVAKRKEQVQAELAARLDSMQRLFDRFRKRIADEDRARNLLNET